MSSTTEQHTTVAATVPNVIAGKRARKPNRPKEEIASEKAAKSARKAAKMANGDEIKKTKTVVVVVNTDDDVLAAAAEEHLNTMEELVKTDPETETPVAGDKKKRKPNRPKEIIAAEKAAKDARKKAKHQAPAVNGYDADEDEPKTIPTC